MVHYSAEDYTPWPMRTGSLFRPSTDTNDMVGSHTRSPPPQPPSSQQHPVDAPTQPSSTSSQLYTSVEQLPNAVNDRGVYPDLPHLQAHRQQVRQSQQHPPLEPDTSQDQVYDTGYPASHDPDITESTTWRPVPHYRFQYSLSHPGSNTEAPSLDLYAFEARSSSTTRNSSLPYTMTEDQVTEKQSTCMICMETHTEKDTSTRLPYHCPGCERQVCLGCLKSWFLDACKDESKMPPRCCNAIPLYMMFGHLSAVQIELYKAKYVEWNTSDRFYCPVPSCSAFIPPRLYVEPCGMYGGFASPSPPNTSHLDESLFPDSSFQSQLSTQKASVATKASVSCPDCHTLICTKCRASFHFGECTVSDLDLALEEKLKKWNIKRCPKCRTGIRKVYGCSHVACRCGANICFGCLQSIHACDGTCEGSEDDEDNDYDIEEDDIDGHAGYHDGDGNLFGDEPSGSAVDTWGCTHSYSLVRGIVDGNSLITFGPMECHRCFRAVHVLDLAANPPQRNTSSDDDVKMGNTLEGLRNLTAFGDLPWNCTGGHTNCLTCGEDPPSHRLKDISRKWSCDCGGSACPQCENEQVALKAREDSTAWECRCSRLLCQACKNS